MVVCWHEIGSVLEQQRDLLSALLLVLVLFVLVMSRGMRNDVSNKKKTPQELG